eukprot:COSAG04_NODE_965_length_9140_cov_5.526048_9_plen_334_part_00
MQKQSLLCLTHLHPGGDRLEGSCGGGGHSDVVALRIELVPRLGAGRRPVLVPHHVLLALGIVDDVGPELDAARAVGGGQGDAEQPPLREVLGGVHHDAVPVGEDARVGVPRRGRHEAAGGAAAGAGAAVDGGAAAPVVHVEVVRAVDGEHAGLPRDQRPALLVPGQRAHVAQQGGAPCRWGCQRSQRGCRRGGGGGWVLRGEGDGGGQGEQRGHLRSGLPRYQAWVVPTSANPARASSSRASSSRASRSIRATEFPTRKEIFGKKEAKKCPSRPKKKEERRKKTGARRARVAASGGRIGPGPARQAFQGPGAPQRPFRARSTRARRRGLHGVF